MCIQVNGRKQAHRVLSRSNSRVSKKGTAYKGRVCEQCTRSTQNDAGGAGGAGDDDGVARVADDMALALCCTILC